MSTRSGDGLHTLIRGKVVLFADFGSKLEFDVLVGKPAISTAEPGCEQGLTDAGQRSGLGGATF